MASISQPILILAISLCIFAISPAQSLTCKSQTFKTSEKVFAHCLDLPVLSSHLHWTYDEANSSLSVAFTAPPPRSDGWVAWAINPTGQGMAGAQAFVAARHSNGSVPVTTYNISSYSSIVPSSKLAFEFWDTSAEFSNNTLTIFATAKVPNSNSLNYIWQVGPGFNHSNGFLEKHDFKSENLAAKGTLSLASTGESPFPSPSASPSPSPSSTAPSSPSGSNKNGGVPVTAGTGNLALCTLASLLVLVIFHAL